MSSFVWIFSLSFCFGGLPLPVVFRRLAMRRLIRFLCGVAAGALVAWSARCLVGTPVSEVLAATGLILGQLFFFRYSRRREDLRGIIAGIFLIFVPIILPFLAIIWFVWYRLTGRPGLSSFLTSLALLPLNLITRQSDVHYVFALFLIWVTAAGALRQLESLAFRGTLLTANPEPRLYYFSRPVRHFVQVTILAGIVLGIFSLACLTRAVYSTVQPDGVFRAGNNMEMVVALTFDDGPHPSYTGAILNILEEKKVKATFFLVGDHVRRYPEMAQKIVASGHEVGNHTYSHANLYRRNAAKVYREIKQGNETIAAITGVEPSLLRPPRGLYNAHTLETCADLEMTIVLWTVSSRDWLEPSVRDIVKQVGREVHPGAVLLFHDSGDFLNSDGGNRVNTVRALPGVIDALRDKGYSFVTVGEMMAYEQAGQEMEG